MTPGTPPIEPEARPSRLAAILMFLRILLATDLDGLYAYIWTDADHVSAYFPLSDLDRMAHYAERRSADSNVYFGTVLTNGPFEPHQRIKISEGRLPRAIFALWADFDFVGPAHQKTNLPRDLADIRSLFILPPSLIVLTGHGAHCYWVFREIWVFDDEREMKSAAVLAAKWGRAAQARAARHGWSLDSVHDLSRVLRVAGTRNLKLAGDICDVVIAEHDRERRYNATDFAEALDLEGAPALAYQDIETPASTTRSTYDPGACAPQRKLEAILLNDGLFRMTWQRRRLDMRDQTASAYDLATANALAKAKWTDAEIIDALIERRRIHGEADVSKYRATYFGPTLARARKNAARFWGEQA